MERLAYGLLAQPAGQFEAAIRGDRGVDPVQAGGVGGAEDFIAGRGDGAEKFGALRKLGEAGGEGGVVLVSRVADFQSHTA